MNHRTNLGITALVFGVGLTGSALLTHHFYQPEPDAPRSKAAWAFVADDMQGLVDQADVIALVRAGHSTTNRVVPPDPSDISRLPFELTHVEVLFALKGAQEGQVLSVERAGGVDPYDGERRLVDMDGGPFTEDSTYLLFLKGQEGTGYYYQLNHQARYEVEGDRLDAVEEEDPVSGQLQGMRVEDAIRYLLLLI